jgi:hypothetical protein
MMCQKNCGSTVQTSLLNMDLGPFISFLQRQLQSINNCAYDNNTATAKVVSAEADFATSFASVVIQWELLVSSHHQQSNNDLLDDTSTASSSYNNTLEVSNTIQQRLATYLSTPEIQSQLMELLSNLAIDDVECVGFDAVWLPCEEDVDRHRNSARIARDMEQEEGKDKQKQLLSYNVVD